MGGGGDLIRLAVGGGGVEVLLICTARVFLGGGKGLFDGFDRDIDLEVTKVVSSPFATHVRYAVRR
jgi:hypothetical protein